MRNFLERLRYKTAAFMYGRYGNDELTKFLMIAAIILMALAFE